MTNSNSVYVAWQAPDTRDWHVVGNLQERNSGYVFKYTKGSLKSSKFTKFSGMTDFHETYVSKELFPLFKNRLLSSKRPEYPRFIKWLGFEDESVNLIDILARSGGLRSTDQLQIFKKIEVDSDGQFEHFFFLHGLSYLNSMANDRVSELQPGQILRFCLDIQNEYDCDAVVVRADKPAEIIGYCPRYLSNDIKKMLLNDSKSVTLAVERISDDAPHSYRLLCKFSGTLNSECKSSLTPKDEFEAIE
ncbi:HIRAN domain-containing protein [Pectobacterium versatile]|uniref:HIRAN domain-containing protein n=1 Tax=Pectobacterium versatile TaxID=2488639 RepID=UPI0020BE9E95|nr:HIRAN domain-containing protein [Pectobacterium versatile]